MRAHSLGCWGETEKKKERLERGNFEKGHERSDGQVLPGREGNTDEEKYRNELLPGLSMGDRVDRSDRDHRGRGL